MNCEQSEYLGVAQHPVAMCRAPGLFDHEGVGGGGFELKTQKDGIAQTTLEIKI